MVVTNGYLYKNIEVLSYSRLSTGQSSQDCLSKCRANQECYSFNYDKLNKWCYLGITEESELVRISNGKWEAGYRKCVEHAGSSNWGSEYSSGTGAAPGPVTGLTVVDSSSTSNVLTVSFTAPASAGSNSDGSASTFRSYKITCTPTTGTGTIRSVTRTYSPLEASCGTVGDTSCTVQFGGLSLVSYTCSVVAINAALLQGPAVVSSAVKVCDLGLVNCAGTCLNGQSDSSNCGTCGTVCSGGKTCNVGVCSCPTGQALCSGVCKSVQTDNSNCGTCDTVCTNYSVCSAGVCGCAAGQTLCNGVCRDLQTSPFACGTCTNSCSVGGSCNAGVCTCGAGYYLSGNTCLACSVTCATCSGSASNQCLSCAGGGVFDAGTKTCSCPTGTYWSGQYAKCVQNGINQCSANECKNYDAATNTCPTNKADGTACTANGATKCIDGYCAYTCNFYADCPDKHTATGSCQVISGQTVCYYDATTSTSCQTGYTNLNGVSVDGCEYDKSSGIPGLIVYQHCEANGWSLNLSLGAYNMDPDTQADASYITVPAGYKVSLYKGADLTCGIFTSNNCPLVVPGGSSLSFCTAAANPGGEGGYNDQVRSVYVERI